MKKMFAALLVVSMFSVPADACCGRRMFRAFRPFRAVSRVVVRSTPMRSVVRARTVACPGGVCPTGPSINVQVGGEFIPNVGQ